MQGGLGIHVYVVNGEKGRLTKASSARIIKHATTKKSQRIPGLYRFRRGFGSQGSHLRIVTA